MKYFSFISFLILGFSSLAQCVSGSPSNNYNTDLEITVEGILDFSQTGVPSRSGQYSLETDDGTYGLTFGPPWFLEQLGVEFLPGDFITVTGMEVLNDTSIKIIVARNLTIDSANYSLRDEMGTPLWQGKGRRTETQKNSKRAQNSGQQSTCMLTYLATTPMQDLSEQEIDDLVYMREEEKLARDVYQYLYQVHGSVVFSNIAKSEQQHMDAIKILLDRYEIVDPIQTDEPGQFTFEAFEDLYQDLTAEGETNLIAGYMVGATIEDLDIADLMEDLQNTDNLDIGMVYQNLMKGSRNHLRAFVSQLNLLGEEYAAQFLTQEDVDSILSSAREGRIVYDADGNALEACSNSGGGQGGRGRK